MATITSTGIGSGLDVTAIVSQLMAIESRPLTLLQQKATSLNSKVSTIGQLQSRTSALRDASTALTSLTLWNQRQATSQNSAAVKVSATGGAATGSYAVQVQSLAAAQTAYSRAFTGTAAELGEGTLTIEIGSWTGEPAPTGFAPKSGSTPLSIDIGPGETSLGAIRDKINAAGAGVTASIINDASGSRLALRSTATGAENAFRISASETVDDGVAGDGLSALAYDATAASPMTRSQAAANAAATINGIAVSSAGNTLSDVADGLTITLLQATDSAVDVSVAPDTEAVKTSINNFVTAFNDVARYLRDQTKYDASTKTGGALQGDRLATTLQGQLRGLINAASTASDSFQSLSDVGISFKADGTLSVSTSKLDSALGNLPELRKLLVADGSDSASSGFVDRFKDFTTLVLGSEGAFESRSASLKGQLSTNTKSQDSLSLRLQQTEARLRRQYQTLDTTMSQLSGTSNYLVQQLALLNRS